MQTNPRADEGGSWAWRACNMAAPWAVGWPGRGGGMSGQRHTVDSCGEGRPMGICSPPHNTRGSPAGVGGRGRMVVRRKTGMQGGPGGRAGAGSGVSETGPIVFPGEVCAPSASCLPRGLQLPSPAGSPHSDRFQQCRPARTARGSSMLRSSPTTCSSQGAPGLILRVRQKCLRARLQRRPSPRHARQRRPC